MSSPPTTRNRQPVPCRMYSQGLHCRFGDKCRFNHDVDAAQPQSTSRKDAHPNSEQAPPARRRQRTDVASSNAALSSQVPSQDTSDARPRPKRGETPCRAWKAGTCTKGAKCWFRHDINVQKPGSGPFRTQEQNPFATPCPAPLESFSITLAADIPRAEPILVQDVKGSAVREREDAIAQEEAAKTISQVVFGSIVTYSAGLDVSNLITGFETCTLRIGNLPPDVKEDDIRTLLTGHGLVNHFHLVIKKKSDRRPEAHVVTDVATGGALASDLDGVEFHEETLVVDMSAANSLEGMNATTGQSSEVLTISWRVPSTRYIAEYVDVDAARVKVKELDRSLYGGRRIKVEMNAQPRGRFVPNLRLNAIKINNLPLSVTDGDVMSFTRALSVKRLHIGGAFGTMYPVEHMAGLVRADLERAVPGGLKKFDDPPSTCTAEGVVSARAHFSSWDDAHIAHTHLSDKRPGIWLRLPDPMYFTLVIPAEQYKAQKAQWDSLSSSIKDKKACTLSVRDSGNVVVIRVSGSVKEATGALKVRVENLARGDTVEGWHRSLGVPGNPFVLRVYSETGVYLRADGKRQTLKVYGNSGVVDRAREMIRGELDRLSSLDHTITLAWHSVGFFVREGIQQLKDTLGENNVRFVMSSRKITVSGGEEARHALDRLIALSHRGSCSLPDASSLGIQTCPVCYDEVSSPHRLGCGHTYCVACLRHFISSALESDQLPLKCLGDEAQCRVPISIPTIQQFLPPATFKRLLEAAFDAYIARHPEKFKPCKTPDCAQIYRVAEARATPQTLHCPSCFSAVCNGCHEDAHDGFSCAESKARRDPAEQERLNDAWIASQGGRVKKCPQCKVPIEKTEGCNHMTCRCGAHICWRCMRVFTAETIYPHMHSEHGTIHGDAPAVLEPADIGIAVNIEEQRELFRQVEMRRAMPWRQEHAPIGILGWREDEDRERTERLARLLRQQREAEEQARRRAQEDYDRRAREQRLLREADERRRRERERQNQGWGCTIM